MGQQISGLTGNLGDYSDPGFTKVIMKIDKPILGLDTMRNPNKDNNVQPNMNNQGVKAGVKGILTDEQIKSDAMLLRDLATPGKYPNYHVINPANGRGSYFNGITGQIVAGSPMPAADQALLDTEKGLGNIAEGIGKNVQNLVNAPGLVLDNLQTFMYIAGAGILLVGGLFLATEIKDLRR